MPKDEADDDNDDIGTRDDGDNLKESFGPPQVSMIDLSLIHI